MTSIGRPVASKRKIFGPRHNSSGSVRAATQKKKKKKIWTDAEKKSDAGKLECRGLLKALKKLRMYLYGVRFLVEIGAKTLVHHLNQPASDLPGSVVNRWLVWIRMFSFEINHVAGKKHAGPDGLSRRGRLKENSDEEEEEEVEKAMDAPLI